MKLFAALTFFFSLPALGGSLLTGTCWVDDDRNVDAKNIGALYAYSESDLAEECQWHAKFYYPETPFSNVVDQRVFNGEYNMIKTTCWIDDDSNVDHTNLGALYAQNSWDLAIECFAAAKNKFPDSPYFRLEQTEPFLAPSDTFKATCWIDDDSNVDHTNVGTLYGKSSRSLREECHFLAQQKFPESPFSKLDDLGFSETYGVVTATCWIDDDSNVDAKNIGKVIGQSTFDLHRECYQAAKLEYPESPYFRLAEIQMEECPNDSGYVEAICWVDDDRNVDNKNEGKLIAYSTRELRSECQWLASIAFPETPYSRLESIQFVTENYYSLKATCWIDDDRNVDAEQCPVTGYTTRELRQMCAKAARDRFGDPHFFRLENIQGQ